jgi:hypothetical protein
MEKDIDFSGHYYGHHCVDLFCVSPTIHAWFLMARSRGHHTGGMATTLCVSIANIALRLK